MRRAAEDGTGAVLHQHEVGDVNGQGNAVIQGMAHAQPGVETLLLRAFQRFLGGAHLAALLDEGHGPGIVGGDLLGQGMLGGDGHETGTEQGVGPGGIDGQTVLMTCHRAVEGEGHAQTLGTADPLGLHGTHPVGPAVHGAEG